MYEVLPESNGFCQDENGHIFLEHGVFLVHQHLHITTFWFLWENILFTILDFEMEFLP